MMMNLFDHKCKLVALTAVPILFSQGCKKAEEPKEPAPPEKEAISLKAEPAPKAAPAVATDTLDVKPTCTVTPEEFATWFSSGKVTENGVVNAADSLVDFQTAGDFYKWSWQMFLWQTSPNQGGLVFNTPPFYDLEADGTLTSNTANQKKSLTRMSGIKPTVAAIPKATANPAALENVDGTGQAGVISGVLMTQDVALTPGGSLVYYAIHVNDVYAYMASGINSNQLTGLNQFPTTPEQLDKITAYAKQAYGVDIKDGNALTLELKSSWVKADPGMDLSKFLTIVADVPLYKKESDEKWTWDGTTSEEVTLACIGYHLVGPSTNHPEMIWATFEHVSNAPDSNFYYTNTSDKVAEKVNWNSDGTPIEKDWLLMSGSGTQQATDEMHMQMSGNEIVATPGHTISPSDTSRTHPWGGKADQSSAVNNTDIISLNQNIQSMLDQGDPRRNYFLVGATWTKNGVPGVGLQLPEVAGSLTLANSTMETYFQFKNCFDCHQGGEINGLSHIFSTIKPLPVKPSN